MSPRLAFLVVWSVCMAIPFSIQDQPPEGHPKETRTDAMGDPLPKGAVVRLGTARLWQPDVMFLAFSPDGSGLAAVSGSGAVRIWEVKTGQERFRAQVDRFMSFDPSWSALAFSPDGRFLALAAHDKTFRVWETATAKEVLKVAHDVLPALAYSPDGKTLATISGNRVSLWNAQSGELLNRFTGCNHLYHLTFTGDGKTVVALGYEKPDRKVMRIHRWNLTTGQDTANHLLEFDRPFIGQLSPDGQFLFVPPWGAASLRRWDTATGKELDPTEAQPSPSYQIAFSPDGKMLTAISRDDRFRIWESATGKVLHQVAGPAGEMRRVALSPDGKVVAGVTLQSQRIHLWDVAQGKEMHSFAGHGNGPLSVVFSSEEKSVLTANHDSIISSRPRPGVGCSLCRWDIGTGQVVDVWRQDPSIQVSHSVFSPNGQVFATANSSGLLRLVDGTRFKEEKTWTLQTQKTTIKSGNDVKEFQTLSIADLMVSPDGATVAASGRGHVKLWERATGKELREIGKPTDSTFPRFCFFPDGKSLLVSDWTPQQVSLSQVDVKTGAVIRAFTSGKDPANAVGVSGSGHTAAVLTGTKVRLYERLTGQERFTLTVGATPLPVLAMQSVSSFTTPALTSGITQLLTIKRCHEAFAPQSRFQGVWSFALAFSPDGRLLVTGGRDGVVRLWDPMTGRAIHHMADHDGEVSSLAFSPDGRWLISGGGNTALVWDVQALLKENQVAPPKLVEGDLNKLWQKLGSINPQESSPALGRLVEGAETAVPFLRRQLTQLPEVSGDKIDRWIADLDREELAVREEASRQLEKWGSVAEPALKKALEKPPSVDTQLRIRVILRKVAVPSATWLQVQRALETLELIGDTAAREALQHLAKEAPQTWIRPEAQAILQRLERRP